MSVKSEKLLVNTQNGSLRCRSVGRRSWSLGSLIRWNGSRRDRRGSWFGLRCWDQVALELDFISFNRIDWPNGLQNDSVRGRTTIAVVSLTGVRTQITERHSTHKKGIISELFVAFRWEWKHSFTTPPSHWRSWPADGVTMNNNRPTQHHNCHGLVADDISTAYRRVLTIWLVVNWFVCFVCF